LKAKQFRRGLYPRLYERSKGRKSVWITTRRAHLHKSWWTRC